MTLNRRGMGDGRKAVPHFRVPSPFRVLSLDPGGTTGWAYAEWGFEDGIDTSQMPKLEEITFESGQIGPDEHHLKLWQHLNEYNQRWTDDYDGNAGFHIVCESFEFRQHITEEKSKAKVELISRDYIGIVKLHSKLYDVGLTMQTATTAKQLCPDKGPQANVKLQQVGWDTPAQRHARDATRHLLRHLVVGLRIREPITDKWLV